MSYFEFVSVLSIVSLTCYSICLISHKWKSAPDCWHSNMHQNLLEGMLKQIAGSCPKVSDSVGLGWGPIICISNKFPGSVDTADLAGTLWELLLLDFGWIRFKFFFFFWWACFLSDAACFLLHHVRMHSVCLVITLLMMPRLPSRFNNEYWNFKSNWQDTL